MKDTASGERLRAEGGAMTWFQGACVQFQLLLLAVMLLDIRKALIAIRDKKPRASGPG